MATGFGIILNAKLPEYLEGCRIVGAKAADLNMAETAGLMFISSYGWIFPALAAVVLSCAILSIRKIQFRNPWLLSIFGGIISLAMFIYSLCLMTPILRHVIVIGN